MTALSILEQPTHTHTSNPKTLSLSLLFVRPILAQITPDQLVVKTDSSTNQRENHGTITKVAEPEDGKHHVFLHLNVTSISFSLKLVIDSKLFVLQSGAGSH